MKNNKNPSTVGTINSKVNMSGRKDEEKDVDLNEDVSIGFLKLMQPQNQG